MGIASSAGTMVSEGLSIYSSTHLFIYAFIYIRMHVSTKMRQQSNGYAVSHIFIHVPHFEPDVKGPMHKEVFYRAA